MRPDINNACARLGYYRARGDGVLFGSIKMKRCSQGRQTYYCAMAGRANAARQNDGDERSLIFLYCIACRAFFIAADFGASATPACR